jgi:nicotinamide-nucleotide amidase
MQIELINVGTELMLGRVLNTHQQWLCRRLSDAGHLVTRQVAVADTGAEIQQAVREALGRVETVIVTGGLGPTSDDLTRQRLAELFGRTLHEDAATLARITEFFAARKRPMPAGTQVQALVPEGALVLANAFGTAPGLAIEIKPNPFQSAAGTAWLIMLPGPPRELRPMFTDSVMPLLRRISPGEIVFVCRTMRSIGIGESQAELRIARQLQPLVERGLELGYCARPGQVDVRLVARAAGAEILVQEAEAIVRERLGSHIYGVDDEEIEEVVVRLLLQRGGTLTLAESCTGGQVADRVTNVPGASAVFLGGFVTYSNAVKQTAVGVSAESLAQHGAVSEPVARAMAEGARRLTGADYALGITGIAGPSGGTPEKPVGTVFIALAGPEGTEAWKMFNPLDRLTFKELTAQQALNQLRLALEGR